MCAVVPALLLHTLLVTAGMGASAGLSTHSLTALESADRKPAPALPIASAVRGLDESPDGAGKQVLFNRSFASKEELRYALSGVLFDAVADDWLDGSFNSSYNDSWFEALLNQSSGSTAGGLFDWIGDIDDYSTGLFDWLDADDWLYGWAVDVPCEERMIVDFWTHWKTWYHKAYRTARREEVAFYSFCSNVRRIVADVEDLARPNWSSFGPRLDLVPGPFNGGIVVPPDLGEEAALPSSKPTTVKEWDWRQLDKVTSAKDQGSCLGCWAYAAAGAVESQLLISTGANASATSIDLSEQLLLDCASQAAGSQSKGCAGGWLADPFTYASSLRGLGFLAAESSYPLNPSSTPDTPPSCNTARLGTIKKDQKYALSDVGYTLLQHWSARALLEAVLEQPVVVSIQATTEFSFYGGGLWRVEDCPSPPWGPLSLEGVLGAGLLTHSLLVVGFNLSAQPPYWVVKNSLGTSWGNQGFGMLELTGLEGGQSYGACLMYTWMMAPTEVLPWDQSSFANPEASASVLLEGAPTPAPAPAPAPETRDRKMMQMGAG